MLWSIGLYFWTSFWIVINLFLSRSRLNSRFHWLLWIILYYFVSDCTSGSETAMIIPDCCTLLLVTKYECVSLKPAWDLRCRLPTSWQGGRRMAEIPHIVGHTAILNPNQATRLQLCWSSSLLMPVIGELQPCEQEGAEQAVLLSQC